MSTANPPGGAPQTSDVALALARARQVLADAADRREQQARDTLAKVQSPRWRSIDNAALQLDLAAVAAAAKATLDEIDMLRQAQTDAIDRLEQTIREAAPPLPSG